MLKNNLLVSFKLEKCSKKILLLIFRYNIIIIIIITYLLFIKVLARIKTMWHTDCSYAILRPLSCHVTYILYICNITTIILPWTNCSYFRTWKTFHCETTLPNIIWISKYKNSTVAVFFLQKTINNVAFVKAIGFHLPLSLKELVGSSGF